MASKLARGCRAAGRAAKKALPIPTWVTVVQKGLDSTPVARYENNQVFLKEIPDEPNERITYRNSLMELCGLSLRDLVEAMRVAKMKEEKKKASAGKAKAVQQSRGGPKRARGGSHVSRSRSR
jgi:hypothetical protein